MLEFKDIIQANATIIAGILVLLTISSFVGQGNASNPYSIYFRYSIAAMGVSLVCAILGEVLIVMGKMKVEKHIQNFKGFALLTLAFGVLYLITTIILYISH